MVADVNTSTADVTRLLFVCLGNICRSPLAKWVFTDLVERRGVAERFHIDSCGTGAWHVGKGADPRTVLVAAQNGLNLPHTARRFDPTCDIESFDLLLAMDQNNRDALLHAGAPRDKVRLFRSFDPVLQGEPDHRLDVPDPYYGGADGFERMYEMTVRASEGLLAYCLERDRR